MVTPDNDWLAYDLRFPLARGYCENPLGLIQDHRQVLEWDPRRPDLQLAVILAVYPDACFCAGRFCTAACPGQRAARD